MKTMLRRLALMSLVLAMLLAQAAFAEPNGIVKGVFDALLAEYLIPIHNSTMLIRDIFLGKETAGNFIIVSSINLLVSALLFISCIRSQDGMIHISEGGQDDFGKSRK